MDHAWLDSLSEDWPSQPNSPFASKPGTISGTAASKLRIGGSKIPRPSSAHSSVQGSVQRRTSGTHHRNSSAVLSERSRSDVNLPSPPKRLPSKLSQEFRPLVRGRPASRSVSVSTNGGSVIHNSVQHKSQSSSPGKKDGNTPEWRRRLIHGDLAYGEQRDLFTSAGAGLEDMFKPPALAKSNTEDQDEEDSLQRNGTTMPSSPPAFAKGRPRGDSIFDIHVDRSMEEQLPQMPQAPQGQGRAVRYRMNEDESAVSSQDSGLSAEQSSVDQSSGRRQANAQEDSQMSAPFLNPGSANVESRKVSNQSAARHEEFSPILIARKSGEDGQINFAPMAFPSAELQKRLEKVQKNQMLLDGSEDNESKAALLENTEDFERLDGFINFRGGRQSIDDSFRHRRLSTALVDTSSMLPDNSLQASTPKRFPSVRIEEPQGQAQGPFSETPPLPPAPHPSPKKGAQLQGSSGSPLKLFGPYDTFTNQTLLRRISQFEDRNTSPTSNQHPDGANRPEDDSRFDAAKLSMAPSRPQMVAPQGHGTRKTTSGSVSQFGAGELDGYEFGQEFSRLSQGRDFDSDSDSPQNQYSITNHPTDARRISVKKRRQRSKATPPSHSRNPSSAHSSIIDPMAGSRLASEAAKSLSGPKNRYPGLDSKRARTSPSKDPTPKRRRTLHESDIAYGGEQEGLDSIRFSHQQMQVVISHKPSRSVLRPRTPTPSQRSSLNRDQDPFDDRPVQADESVNQSMEFPESAVKVNGTGRKASFKTDDFLDEAHKVMEKIRMKVGLQNGLASVEESEEERERQHEDAAVTEDTYQESTREPFSRPPSREGRPIPRLVARQQDPELVSYLKKYEEHSDMGDIITSSLRNLGVSKDDIAAAKAAQQRFQASMAEKSTHGILEDSAVMSDPPNITISENVHRGHGNEKRSTGAQSHRDSFRSHGSGSSSESGYSSGRSNQTGSSRGSDTRRTIAPQTVSHLIPDQVGNMVLDRQRNIWVKNKKRPTRRPKRSNTLLSEGSEDDPFADIPDLTVDVTKEIRHLKTPSAELHLINTQAVANGVPAASPLKSILVRDLGTEHTKKAGVTRSVSTMMKRFAEADDESVEHEITIHEDRFDSSSPKRRMTITFSSPIASIIQDVVAGSSDVQEGESSMFEQSAVDVAKPQLAKKQRCRPVSNQSVNENSPARPRSATGIPPKYMSLRGESFVPRPVSRIDEQDENVDDKVMDKSHATKQGVSTVEDRNVEEVATRHGQPNANVLFSTPARPKAHPQPENAQTVGLHVGRLSLSPLSEFSAHHNRSFGFEVSYVLGDQNFVTGDGSRRVMSQGVRDLVDKIAQTEPFEPYWEDMKDMVLQNKRIGSLHMLDKFCGNLVTLDASHNSIRNLDGIPSCVRDFKISHNLLSEMTSWGRLANLQYLDVSNNDIKSLSHFRDLVHLRSLVADNTNLTSVDGIKYHDALQSLRARGNLIEEIDLDDTDLQKLTALDLENNKIKKIENLHQLPLLSTLNLKGNMLEEFGHREELSLKYLSISGNRLKTLDVEGLPHLHQLYADRNRLRTISGLSKVTRLDSLSLREQEGSRPLDMSFLEDVYEIRKLFLSGNRVECFIPPRDFLNLQLLDLANCGLQSLPDDFGEMMPNLRVINLNFNGLADISCLLYISRLRRLYIAGNRLDDIRSILPILTQFPWLSEIDLRDNPVTQCFYPPVQLLVQKDEAQVSDPFKLPDASVERDAKFCSRLDIETRILRRVYERKFVRMCKQLRKLDGLPLNRQIRNVKDAVFKAMVERGMLLRYDGRDVYLEDGNTQQLIEDGSSQQVYEQEEQKDESTRWPAEDSFA